MPLPSELYWKDCCAIDRTLHISQACFFATCMYSLQWQGVPKSQLLGYDKEVWKELAMTLGFQ
jgi:hypothetical protein